MSDQTGSTWWCALCQVTVWVRHAPKRRRYQRCRKCGVSANRLYVVSVDRVHGFERFNVQKSESRPLIGR
jgi:hypothetical protein